MEAEQIYLIRGSSVSHTPFFEHQQDCRVFLELVDHYLKDYVSISSFQNNPNGWVMIITTKSAELIKKAYKARRALSKKCKKEFEFQEVWQMLSDQIRILLSTYVKKTNQATGRKGSKVRHRYERFVFESAQEALEVEAQLEEEFHPLEQPVERYRPSDALHDLREAMIATSIYMCCALLRVPEQLEKLGMSCLELGLLSQAIARNLIHSTLNHHFPT